MNKEKRYHWIEAIKYGSIIFYTITSLLNILLQIYFNYNSFSCHISELLKSSQKTEDDNLQFQKKKKIKTARKTSDEYVMQVVFRRISIKLKQNLSSIISFISFTVTLRIKKQDLGSHIIRVNKISIKTMKQLALFSIKDKEFSQ